MSRLPRTLALALLITPITHYAYCEPPQVAVDSPIRVAMVGATFRLRVTVEPHRANRQVCLYTELDEFPLRTSCWGAGTRTEWRWLRVKEAGVWEVYATVERNDGTTVRSMPLRLVVRGPDPTSDPF